MGDMISILAVGVNALLVLIVSLWNVRLSDCLLTLLLLSCLLIIVDRVDVGDILCYLIGFYVGILGLVT